jgi:hypothetical protein
MMMPKPWEVAGIGQIEYSKWPMSKKKELLKKMGYKFSNLFQRLWTDFKLWKNRPKGGYLRSAYIRESAERRHIEKWCPGVKFDW